MESKEGVRCISISISMCIHISISTSKEDTKKMQSKVDGRCISISISTRCSWLVPPPSSDRLYAEILAAKNVILCLFCAFCSRNCCWWWWWGICCSHIHATFYSSLKIKLPCFPWSPDFSSAKLLFAWTSLVVINNLIILKWTNWICVLLQRGPCKHSVNDQSGSKTKLVIQKI